jgi:hypothetical protein
MKHFINILVILILTGFTIGLTWVCYHNTSKDSVWGILYVPLLILIILWGAKLNEDYSNN